MYNSFDDHPIDLCFLRMMYLTITTICVGCSAAYTVYMISKIDLLGNDRARYIPIFTFILLGLYFGYVDKNRIGLIDLYYGRDALFIPIEVVFYSTVFL